MCLEFLLQVFKCASATCGFFYHPQCVAKLLHLVISDVPTELVKNIAKGEPFTCPAHYCRICKEMENKHEHELHFAVCRRCPKSYHRKCLPRFFFFFSFLCFLSSYNDAICNCLEAWFSSCFYQKDCFWRHSGRRHCSQGLGKSFAKQSHSYLLLVSVIVCRSLCSPNFTFLTSSNILFHSLKQKAWDRWWTRNSYKRSYKIPLC